MPCSVLGSTCVIVHENKLSACRDKGANPSTRLKANPRQSCGIRKLVAPEQHLSHFPTKLIIGSGVGGTAQLFPAESESLVLGVFRACRKG